MYILIFERKKGGKNGMIGQNVFKNWNTTYKEIYNHWQNTVKVVIYEWRKFTLVTRLVWNRVKYQLVYG